MVENIEIHTLHWYIIYDILLVTDAGCPINKADVEVVVEQFAKMDAGLNVM